MVSIHLDDATAARLNAAAAASGVSVEEFVRRRILTDATAEPPAADHPADSNGVIGLMRDEAQLLDQIEAEALAARGRPFRTTGDHD